MPNSWASSSVGASIIVSASSWNISFGETLKLRPVRTDNGQWCLPGGGMEPGESIIETCVREVLEETGLHVRIVRLIGIYSSPHYLIERANGNREQAVVMHFEATPIGGT